MADSKSRKWQLTFNNPQAKNLDHETLKRLLGEFKSLSTPVIKCKKMAGKKCNKVAEGEEKR